jgi:lipoprotein-releasing system ATP-binding protein
MIPVVEAREVHKSYVRNSSPPIEVLRGISLRVQEGEFLAVMGPSGAGKSTLLHILGLIDRPSQGEVVLKGKETKSMGDKERAHLRNRFLGFVFQAHYLLPEFTALENVAIPLVIKGEKGTQAKDRAVYVLEKVGLGTRIHHKPGELSGGEQQRVAIARALVHSPALLLADEPTGNLDRERSIQLMELLLSLHREQGMTVIMVTHDHLLASMAQRVIKLVDGRLSKDEEPFNPSAA